jgi:hypothetical protein
MPVFRDAIDLVCPRSCPLAKRGCGGAGCLDPRADRVIRPARRVAWNFGFTEHQNGANKRGARRLHDVVCTSEAESLARRARKGCDLYSRFAKRTAQFLLRG